MKSRRLCNRTCWHKQVYCHSDAVRTEGGSETLSATAEKTTSPKRLKAQDDAEQRNDTDFELNSTALVAGKKASEGQKGRDICRRLRH